MNTFKRNIEFLNLDYKKELSKIIVVLFLSISVIPLSFIFLKQTFIAVFITMGVMVLNYLFITSYSSKKQKILTDRMDEFVTLITYFQMFISNKENVYHAFESLLTYASPWMANEIKKMIDTIDIDKSVQPYVTFSRNFESPVIENIMVSIYQMVDEGENELRITQFSHTFEEFSKNHHQGLLQKKKKSLDTINVFPLIGAGFITLIVTYGTINVIGDLMNVI